MKTTKLAEEISIELESMDQIVHHGYGFQIEWDIINEGQAAVDGVFSAFKCCFGKFS